MGGYGEIENEIDNLHNLAKVLAHLEEEEFITAVTEEASTTRCRVAPAQTNPRRREGDPQRKNCPTIGGPLPALTPPPWYVGSAHAWTRVFLVLHLGCCVT